MEPIPNGMVVDHKKHPPRNENKYDNRKENLEIKTTQENSMNCYPHSNNTSGVSGVNYRNGKWIARIGYMNTRISLGSFNTKEEAVKARKDAEIKYYGNYSFDANNKEEKL